MKPNKTTKRPKIPCDKCVGCSACAQSCPAGCISMQVDAEGFFYPAINEDSCLHCHLCESVCPVYLAGSVTRDVFKASSRAYALICRDESLFARAGSGGAFSLMARKVLERGGVVVGAAWTQDWLVEHIAAETWEEYQRICGTKYLQSNLGGTLKQTRDYLKTGRQVLFCGTGCQIAGLTSFLRKDYSNLVAVNIACYGAPSPGVWSQYLRDLQKKFQLGIIHDVQFRRKEDGSSLNMVVEGSLNVYRNYVYGDPYGWGLVNDAINRPCCENCLFKGASSLSDITIGDAWGIETYDSLVKSYAGISVVVAHSPKGTAMASGLKADCSYFRQCPLPEAIAENMGIIHTTKSHTSLRDSFFVRFQRGAESYSILIHLQRGSLRVRILNRFRRLKARLKHLIKKLIRQQA